MPNRGKGRKRRNAPNVSQRGTAPSLRPNNLPSQYNFTPAPVQVPPAMHTPDVPTPVQPGQSTTSHFWDYPPPQRLFQSTLTPQCQVEQPHSEEVQRQATSEPESPTSPIQASVGHSQPSSQGNNFQQAPPVLPELQEDTLRALNALLTVPGRENFTTVLHPEALPNTTWFGKRDKGSKLVRSIREVFTNKFDGPYYSWKCVPQDRQERYFLEFAVKKPTHGIL
ncbi:uncharacterized protein LOC111830978 [Capsella rubella]|uniref:uncharacterized protein LOC111830978 n=1 Tax=Capsella rubella TaxID=81985 RepID=UPI000CD58E42|nr:uncharacterized protein LOC111830978 [Capsella rubella]